MIDKDHINGLSTDYGYDIINRVTGKKVHTLDSMQSIFATEYKYDINSQITQIVNTAGGRRYSQNYEYGKDGLLTKYTFSANKTIEYSYDGLSRLDKKVFKTGADNDLITKYLYKDSDRRQPVMECYTTNFIKSEIINNHNYSYDYDALGNIIRISEKTRADIGNPKEVVSYEYDDLSQLTRENNKNLNQTITYEYDSGGNILNKKIYPLTAGEITGSPTETITYSYENSNWCDQLTAYNGQQITYDEIGNPTSYLDYNMSWFGRQLNSLSGSGLDVGYAYDQSGTRISKTVNGVKYEYQYDGSKLFYEKRDNAEFYYQYDGSGNLSTIIYYDGNGNRAQYYVLCNSRGDVVDIYNQNGTIAAHYIYDSWGNTVSILDNDVNGNEITDPNNIGIINQIRYRGYYLDTETGYYYLMSRYYNPEIGRFLNVDCGIFIQNSILESNVYSYCINNPIVNADCMGMYTEKEQTLLDKANSCFKSKMGTKLNGYSLVEIDPDFERKYEIVTISYIYQKDNDEYAYKSAVFFYGKVGDIRKMADKMFNMYELNIERQCSFISLLGEFIGNLIVAQIWLLTIFLVAILNYNWINQSAEYKSWVSGLSDDDYYGHIQSLMEWRTFG